MNGVTVEQANGRPGNEQDNNSYVISYMVLRRAVGLFGLFFPLVLAIGAYLIFNTGIQRSVSSYYHTGMGDVFVGTLCVIGVFLFSYKGPERKDDIAGDLACVFAIGMALFPTTEACVTQGATRIIGMLHLTFAALFFLVLIYFCLFLFTKTDQEVPNPKKILRNQVYRACGYIMAACIILITVYSVVLKGCQSSLSAYQPVFWLETVAVIAFGVSWLVKGESIPILKDQDAPGSAQDAD